MKRVIFGEPEKIVPSCFCKNFSYAEKEVAYPIQDIHFRTNARGCVLELPIQEGEQFFGLGLQLKAFNLTGKTYTLRVNADPVAETGDSHAPAPFFVSNKGYGIYIDTARYVEFDFGRKKISKKSNPMQRDIHTSTQDLYKEKQIEGEAVVTVQIPVAKGVTVYIIEGETITDIVAKYNMLSGGGCDVPEWSLGAMYRCCAKYSQEQVMKTVEYFQDKNFPIAIIGLEPGWQTMSYSCSFVWNSELYPNAKAMVESLYAQGYHINLWEHAFTHPTSPMYEKLLQYCGNYEVWNGIIPDFSYQESKDVFSKHHIENITFGLIDGFKLDECDSGDYTNGWSFPLCTQFAGGMDGEQYHSLFGTLYMQAIMQVTSETLSEVRNAGALAASYPFVLYSDLYDHRDFVRGLTTAGFSGMLWTPEVRHAENKEEFLRRLQSTVFSPQCVINGWYCEELPWLNFGCEEEVRQLLQERVKLIPRLKKAFERYKATGVPPIRALVSDYSKDEETYKIDDEYLFGDDLLVAPIIYGETSRKVYLPQGEWMDYWTGEPVENGWIEVNTSNIPVFVKK